MRTKTFRMRTLFALVSLLGLAMSAWGSFRVAWLRCDRCGVQRYERRFWGVLLPYLDEDFDEFGTAAIWQGAHSVNCTHQWRTASRTSPVPTGWPMGNWYAATGDFARLQSLLSVSPDAATSSDHYGQTALHWAYGRGDDRIKVLLQVAGARQLYDVDGLLPTDWAVVDGIPASSAEFHPRQTANSDDPPQAGDAPRP